MRGLRGTPKNTKVYLLIIHNSNSEIMFLNSYIFKLSKIKIVHLFTIYFLTIIFANQSITNAKSFNLCKYILLYEYNLYTTREIALMIQLEQQQHREFWVGWWGGVLGWGAGVGHIPTTYIQLAGAGSTIEK